MANIDRLLNIDVFTDDDVEMQNGVTLSQTFPPDEHGPVPRIEIHHRNRSARTHRQPRVPGRQGRRAAARARRDEGLSHQQAAVRHSQPLHDADGTSAEDSVLDANAEARWVKRLFVADNSALANGLGGPNPTLTTQALATRTAEKIFTALLRGIPGWRRVAGVLDRPDRHPRGRRPRASRRLETTDTRTRSSHMQKTLAHDAADFNLPLGLLLAVTAAAEAATLKVSSFPSGRSSRRRWRQYWQDHADERQRG